MEAPAVWVHPLHHGQENNYSIWPLLNTTAVTNHKELTSFAREEVTSHATVNGGFPSTSALSYSARIVGSYLVVTCANQEMEMVPEMILLRFADVISCRVPGKANCTILAVGLRESESQGKHDSSGTRGCFGSVWIFIVSSEMVLQEVLTSMGSAGAIRSDFLTTFDIAEKVGAGSVATVYRAKNKLAVIKDGSEPDADSALKIYSAENGQREVLDLIFQESKFLMAAQRHPNIVGFHGLFYYAQDDGKISWAMNLELCAGGDLYDRIVAKGVFNENVAAEFMFGISLALCHLHNRGIVHRDVKTENILIADHNRPVLADFGIAARADDEKEMDRRCGSPGYTAPEVLAGEKYGDKVDIFGLGVISYFILSGKVPFSGSDICSTLRRTLRCRVNLGLEQFAKTSAAMQAILLALLQRSPDLRPSSSATVKHIHDNYASKFNEETLKAFQYSASQMAMLFRSEDSSSLDTSCGTEAMGGAPKDHDIASQDGVCPKPTIPQAPRGEHFQRRAVRSSDDSDDSNCVKRLAIAKSRVAFMSRDGDYEMHDSETLNENSFCDRHDDVRPPEPPETHTSTVSKLTLSRLRPLQRKGMSPKAAE